MTAPKLLSALFLMGLIGQSFGFAGLTTSSRKLHATKSHQNMDTSTSLSAFTMMLLPDDLDVDSPLLTTMSSLLLTSMWSAIWHCSSTLLDPNVEAEVLIDMSHIALDFTLLLNSSSFNALLKKTSVIGRVLVIFADYIPDHSIHPEELVMQLIMLALAVKKLLSPSMENFTKTGESPRD
jgi:hypothetical protein